LRRIGRIQEGTRSTKNELKKRLVNKDVTKDRWGSPGRKQTWQLLTDSYTDGVEVWPNVSSWMRDKSRFKVSQVICW